MKNRMYNIDRTKPVVSQIQSIFFNISRIKSISVSKDFFNIIQKTDSLRDYYNINNTFMNVPITVSEQEYDIIITK